MRGYQSLGIATTALWFFFLAQQASSVLVCEDYIDCEALLRFKRGIDGDPDGNLRSWLGENPLCNWTGVTCHPSLPNRVVSLLLEGTRLRGTLSPFLSNLSLLTDLSLRNNTFRGEIPSSFGELSRLEYLDLSENDLQFQIPASLQGCRSLEFVDLTGNNLSGVIPKELGAIENLTALCLSVNRLTGSVPSSLSNLTELKILELGGNYFTGKIPPELGELRKLEIFYIHTNYLEGSIPSALSNCTALREISMSQNLLIGEIPAEIGSMQNLEAIYLLMNNFSGKIPVSVSNLSRLVLFDLSLNRLEGEVPMEFGKLGSLENLQLHSNDLVSGSDNSSLRFLTALTNCTRLKKLHLGACLFSGKLPDSIGGLSKQLFYLNLLNNRITGNLPESIGNLSGLVNLFLWFNFLDGKIPASFGKLGLLQRLNLGRNRLGGTIPREIGQMGSLGLLDLSNNSISGTIPQSICDDLGQLRYLYLSHNRLSGTLSAELTRCSDLMLLDLSYNRFEGSVPVEIGMFTNLGLSLNLSNNNFEGNLPETIGKLTSLEAIDFSKNNFSGVIPSSIGNCISLEYLNFSNNVLEGSIPDSLKKIVHLETLDLSHNRLNGNVPVWIGNIQNLKLLNLSYNKLSGEVPSNGSLGNFSRSSFLGNDGLCSDSSKLGLLQCEFWRKKQKMKKKKKVLYLTVLVLISIILCTFVAFVIRYLFFKKREKKRDSTAVTVPSSTSIRWTRSYTERELEIATNGFSEENLVGIGSFGSVYKAVVDNGRTVVAVKVFHTKSGQSFDSLKRECEILSEIKHRNLLRIVGLSWNFRFKALVLEFIPNGNLEQHLYPGEEQDSCGLTFKERLSIAIDIANGLEYLQEGCPTRIVHCDLKPQNVLIDYDLVAHIADFGIGKLLLDEPNEYTTTTDFLRGTVGYIPPEYGQGLKISVKGDVYSFGIMVLEMMTRKRPTSGFFSNGLNLRKWVLSCFPSNVMNAVDAALKNSSSFGGDLERLERCCVQVLNVALMCSEQNPHDRPLMSSVVQMLRTVANYDLRLEDIPDEIQVSKELKKVGEEEQEEMSILYEFR